ncbi:hypothetical protein HOG98_02195 [bacterium]|jgi:sterol desaturase/sphingolipid hydroxylase (fatty acid hydroxylase superfamily)|nr:hypothetical protein [bacterium]
MTFQCFILSETIILTIVRIFLLLLFSKKYSHKPTNHTISRGILSLVFESIYIVVVTSFVIDVTSVFNIWSLFFIFFLHITVVEVVYYWFHRLLHHPKIYQKIHRFHHLEINPSPESSLCFHFAERFSYTLLFSIPVFITSFVFGVSFQSIMVYLICFDVLNLKGHISESRNIKNISELEGDDYSRPNLIYTSRYHHIHHLLPTKNFSLFMPFIDKIFRTYKV